ncbi:hypothetical protein LTR50_004952 [Elasticomyces elasticus]|nr:hypothetical protein LTR50_004952 [Elasticomyces elasticus]
MWTPSRCSFWTLCLCLLVLPLVEDSVATPWHGSDARCTRDNIQIRRECRYDDFTATHLNQTLTVHANTFFIHWHRHLLFLFEQALIKECGYQHTLPYWDWPLYVDNLYTSKLFDGSEHSLGGNGAYVPGLPDINEGGGVFVPRGTGGGCVTTGPFANITVPFKKLKFFDIFVFNGVLPSTALNYDPHCLTRDISIGAVQWGNQANVSYLISQPDFPSFNYVMNGALGLMSVHTAGHQAGGGVNGDGSSTFGANADPFFYLHHAMVDLTYTVWQALDSKRRQYNITGGNNTAYLTSTAFNIPPSPIVTLDFELNWGFLGQPRQLRDIMSVTSGPYCYKYDYDYDQYPKPTEE